GGYQTHVGAAREPPTASGSPRAGQVTAAVDRNGFSRDPSGAVRGEEGNQIRDLLRIAGTTERVRLLRPLEEGRVVRFVDAAAAVQVGHDHAGVDGIDADA